MPVPFVITPTGTILVEIPDTVGTESVVIYARVSSSDQKSDLDRQVLRLAQYASANGLLVARVVTEIGSGLNGHRPKFLSILKNKENAIILAEHRDRVSRFGFEYIEAALAAQGRKFLIADSSEFKNDLVQDMVEILTSFYARLYGQRAAKNKAAKALKVLQNAN